jgi:hypothetical protein
MAFSISPTMPNCGVGKCPDLIMLAVVIDSLGPISGDEEPTAAVSSAVGQMIVNLMNDIIGAECAPFEFICRCTSRIKFHTSEHPSGS